MGVSGFFTSWAMRRATSRQAAMRCPFSSSVRSSNTISVPICRPASSLSAFTEIKKLRGLPSMVSFRGNSMVSPRDTDRLSIMSLASSKNWPVNNCLKLLFKICSDFRLSIFSADLFMVEMMPLAFNVTTPAETLLSTISMNCRFSSISIF